MKLRTFLCVSVLHITLVTIAMGQSIRGLNMSPLIGIGKTQSGTENILQKDFQVGPGGTLFLDAAIGTVDVRSVNTGIATIKVIPQLKTDSAEERERLLRNLLVEASQQQNDVRVTAEFRRETPDDERRQIRLRFEVSIPHNYNLELDTVGSVVTSDLRGNVRVETAGGDISLGKIEGDVVAASSGGKISFKEVMGSLRVETGGGSFRAYLSQQPRSDSNISTAGGKIDMELAQSVGVDLDAVTGNGRVYIDDPALTEPNTKRNVLQASINGGGPKLVLRAAAGSIYLRTQ